MKIIVFFLVFAVLLCAGTGVFAQKDKIVYDFEQSNDGWDIPGWSFDRGYIGTYFGKTLNLSMEKASSGDHSLALVSDFPGYDWSCAIIEKTVNLDLTGYETISVDVYVSKGAPTLLQAQIILTVGDARKFVEMKNPGPLKPGQWTTIKARLESPPSPGSEEEPSNTSDFRGRGPRRLYNNIDKVEKVAVRIEYNSAPPNMIGPRYGRPIYIDNFVIE